MRKSKNILTDKEMELVSLLMQDCQSTGDIQAKLKRLFAGVVLHAKFPGQLQNPAT